MAPGMYLCGHSSHHDANILSRRYNPNLKLDESKVAKCRLHLSCNQVLWEDLPPMIGLVHRSPAWLCRPLLYPRACTAHVHVLYNDSLDCRTGCLDCFTIWLECTPITRAAAPLVHCSSAACIAMQAALPQPCVCAAHIAALYIVPIA